MDCRPGCGACCIAPSISTLAKPAGEACVHLTPDYRCTLFGSPRRPSCCSGLQASAEMCGQNREQALAWLAKLDHATAPPANRDRKA
ncbi:MAG: YkgJ family cysteine cluster protein [Sulfuritalea sp.]|nr:YkgJ family cysteine cluster protein [Sulfuritalea sp.]